MANGVQGISWQVHGGGFYEMSKYTLAPPSLPEDLIWHKWQSYWTWISGFTLLCWVYYGQSSFFLIDPSVMALQPWQAALIGVASLALGWVVYDLICKSPLARNDATLLGAVFVYVVATSYVYTLVFSPRGALIHTGALMATMMTANVAMIIMPNQRKSIARLLKGESPDPKWGKEAKQRSTHNNYITLPVLFMMLSNHYPGALRQCADDPGAGDLRDRRRGADPLFLQQLARRSCAAAVVGVARRRDGAVGRVLDRHLGLARRAADARPRRAGDPRRRRRRAEGAGGGRRRWSRPAAPCAMRRSRSGRGSARRRRG